MVSPSGGFGPVADDGYGVSYMIASDDQVGEPALVYNCSPVVFEGFAGGGWGVICDGVLGTDILPRLIQEVVQSNGEREVTSHGSAPSRALAHIRIDQILLD